MRDTEAFYAKHGGKTLIYARFVPIIRTFAPFVAGVAQMPYSRFIVYSVFGGIGWVTFMTLLGYGLGAGSAGTEVFRHRGASDYRDLHRPRDSSIPEEPPRCHGLTAVLRHLPFLLKRTLLSALDDGCFAIAKGAAYSSLLLSFFPVLTSAATILVQTRADFVARTMSQFLQQIVPPGSEEIVFNQFRIRGQRPTSLLIVAGYSVSLGRVERNQEPDGRLSRGIPDAAQPFVPTRETAVAIGLVFLAAIPLVLASALVLFGGEAERLVLKGLSVDPYPEPACRLMGSC